MTVGPSTVAASTVGASTVGIVVNPAAGKDIRRLVSAASPTSDMAKIGIVRRAVLGAIEGGAKRVVLTDDRRALAARAIDRLADETHHRASFELLPSPPWDASGNTVAAAATMADDGVGALVVLGGDGTHRDVVKGWRRAPMVPLSTGTNNVFPRHHEATVAGHAAGAVAAGSVELADVAWPAKVLDVEVERGDGSQADADLALVDLALVDGAFTASRAVWDVDAVRALIVAIAEPATVGLSAIAARVAPTSRHHAGGVHLRLGGPGATCRAPIAPGLYRDVTVTEVSRVSPGEEVVLDGPGVLSYDGERDVVLHDGDRARVRVSTDGPWVIDVDRALATSTS